MFWMYSTWKGIEKAKKYPENLKNWLYADNWSEEKLAKYEALSVIPGISHYMDYVLDKRADEEYLRRYGLTYADIHDPRKLKQVGSAVRGLEWVSSNVRRIYR